MSSPDEEIRGSEQKVPLLVHMSTDQVLCGSYSNTREDDTRENALEPINAYGRSKKVCRNVFT